MKIYSRFIGLILCLLASFSCLADGEMITHNFSAMWTASPKLISFNVGSTVGTSTDGMVYTCSGTSAAFGVDLIYSSVVSINLPKKDNQVIISPAVERLDSMAIMYYYPSSFKTAYTDLKIYLSVDGEDWGTALVEGETITYSHMGTSSGMITVLVPQDAYYVKIVNTKNNNVSIPQIKYHQSSCTTCFRYRPE